MLDALVRFAAAPDTPAAVRVFADSAVSAVQAMGESEMASAAAGAWAANYIGKSGKGKTAAGAAAGGKGKAAAGAAAANYGRLNGKGMYGKGDEGDAKGSSKGEGDEARDAKGSSTGKGQS